MSIHELTKKTQSCYIEEVKRKAFNEGAREGFLFCGIIYNVDIDKGYYDSSFAAHKNKFCNSIAINQFLDRKWPIEKITEENLPCKSAGDMTIEQQKVYWQAKGDDVAADPCERMVR